MNDELREVTRIGPPLPKSDGDINAELRTRWTRSTRYCANTACASLLFRHCEKLADERCKSLDGP